MLRWVHHRKSWHLFWSVYFPVRLYIDHTSAVALVSRKFKTVRGAGCYCLWHKRCKCYHTESQYTTGGRSLSQMEYTGAGFLGDLPPMAAVAQGVVRGWNTLVASLVLMIGYLVVALTLGMLKAVSPFRSYWLWMVGSSKRQVDVYKEPELKQFPVIRDDHGYCVHPKTMSRHIQLMDGGKEFITNTLFFVSLPTTLCQWCYNRTNGYYSMTRKDSCYILSGNQKAHDDSSEQPSDCDLQQQIICCNSQNLLESNWLEYKEWRTMHAVTTSWLSYNTLIQLYYFYHNSDSYDESFFTLHKKDI